MANTKYEYSYNGKILVKASRISNYEYACIDTGRDNKLVQISRTEDGAKQEWKRRDSWTNEGIQNNRRVIKAIEAGKTKVRLADGRRSFIYDINHTIEEEEDFIKEKEALLEYRRNFYKIVKVEKREI